MAAILSDAQFGVPLETILERPYERHIPSLVKDLCFYLSKCVNVVGIFRIVPPQKDVEEAVKAVNQRISRFNYKSDNPHVVAALLKKFFADLPGGLIATRFQNRIINSFGNLEEIKIIVNEFPTPHRVLLLALLSFLNLIAEHAAVNQMTTTALASVFAPLFLQIGDTENILLMEKASLVVETIMTHLKQIYEKPVKTHTLIEHGHAHIVSNKKMAVLTLKSELELRISELSAQLKFIEKQIDGANASDDIEEILSRLRSTRVELERRLDKVNLVSKISYVPQMLSCKTRLKSGHFSLTGRRPQMEDRVIHLDDFNSYSALLTPQANRSIYAVFDGHAGDEIAVLAEQYLPKYVVKHLASKMTGHDIIHVLDLAVHETDHFINAKANAENIKSGSTMVVVYIQKEDLYVANLGDSEAVMGNKKDDGTFSAFLVSKKHKPEDPEEVDRMVAGGALVARGRVFGKLAVSRALGDSDFKIPKAPVNHVSNDPYLNHFPLVPRNDFLILACDGLWDVVTYQQAVDMVAAERAKGTGPEEAAQKLAQTAYDSMSQDNISVIVVYFDWAPFESAF